MPRSGTLTAFVMLVIFATMSLLALGFPDKARTMPLMVGIPGTLLALLQFVNELRKVPAMESEALAVESREKRRQELKLFAWLGIFFVGVMAFGFVWAAPVLVFAFLRFGLLR